MADDDPKEDTIMKASAFWLPTAITILALASVDTALAQKRVRSTETARQELDLLTAEETSGAAANQSGPGNPERMTAATLGQLTNLPGSD